MGTLSSYKLASPPTIYDSKFYDNIRLGKITIHEQEIKNSRNIDVLDPPINPTDATNKAYVDSLAGGGVANPNSSVQFNNSGVFGGSSNLTFTGSTLNMTNGIVTGKLTLNNPPTLVNDATNKAYVDSKVTPPGGISTNVQFNQGGAFSGSSDFIWNDFTKFLYINGFITLPNAPINPTDAVNKAYVDSTSGGNPSGPDTSLQFNNGGAFAGSTDLLWNDGTKFLTVNGTVTLPNLPTNNTDATNKAYVDSKIGSNPGGPAQAIQFNSNPSGLFSGTNDFTWDNINKIMSVNGSVVANNYVTTSDAKFKTNINHISNPIDVLNKVEGYSYNLKDSVIPTFGVMAQEIEKIEELGNLVKDLGTHKSVDYQQFIPLLIEGFKTLNRENNIIKKEIKKANYEKCSKRRSKKFNR